MARTNAHWYQMVVRFLNLQEKKQKLDEWKARQPEGAIILSLDPEGDE